MTAITAFVITNRDDPSKQHRIEIPPERQSADDWHAHKVEDGLMYRIDFANWYLMIERQGDEPVGEVQQP